MSRAASISPNVAHFGRNEAGGRDLIVGDIHGHFTKLQRTLASVGFDAAHDRLFSVGDLVDRGPESHLALDWLRQPWFFAIRGNHEQAAIDWIRGELDKDHYAFGYGGHWNLASTPAQQRTNAQAFALLPLAIELETEQGLVGIVHADCPLRSWTALTAALAPGRRTAPQLVHSLTMSLSRWRGDHDGHVEGVRAVVVGHMTVDEIAWRDNHLYIDTGGGDDGHFTILDAHTLAPMRRERPTCRPDSNR